MNLNLSEREKKIILAELISVVINNNIVNQAGLNLIRGICEHLRIDEEFIEEFSNAIESINVAKNELFELINE